ncbi:Epoxyqueuosine reductase [Comamonas aquatica]|nr:Epoxyqueuosine reductase [Comamonas aquatica]
MVCSSQLVPLMQDWARELGFSQIGVSGVDLSSCEDGLLQWLAQGFHGQMQYMQAHGLKRARPAELVPGTVSVITARMDYLPSATPQDWQAVEWARLQRPQEAIVSVYARGRDYHKVLRNRLQKLAERIAQEVGPLGHRAFTDSAPVMEAELARRSGQGWRGKHTLVLSRDAGSMFFLGKSMWTWRCPRRRRSRRTAAVAAAAWTPAHGGHRGAAPRGRAALHLLPDHRARRGDPARAASPDGQPHLRL